MSFGIKRILSLTALFSLWGVLFFAPAGGATLQGLQAGMEGPEFSLKTVGGETRTFADLKGEKLTMLVFWSTWSNKSEKVLARMEKLHEKYQGLGLAIVGVSADEPRISDKTVADMKAVQAKLKIGFPMLVDQGLAVFHEYGVIALPTMVVLDKERMIRYELSGFPLVGAETLVDFVVATIEGKKTPHIEEKARYQPNKNALRFYNMGKTTLKSKRMAETAEMWFKKAVEADSAFVLPHLSLGKLYLQRGDTALAQVEYQEVLTREPANVFALCESGMILVSEGKGVEGTTLLDAARKAEDAYAPCYYYAGYAYGKEGKLADALKMFDEAEKANPLDYNTFVYKGKVFEGEKDRQKGAEAYKKALEIILSLN
jgi:peroxiredoxin/Tfp pilus assembly protein PilF